MMQQGRYGSRLLFNEQIFLGVDLGSDFVSEHECGIDDLYQDFGVKYQNTELLYKIRNFLNPSPVRDKKIFKCPDNLIWIDNVQIKEFWSGIYYHPYHQKINSSNISLYPIVIKDQSLATFWDNRSFAIFSKNTEEIKHIKVLYEAFQAKDVSFLFSFKELANPGFKIVISHLEKLIKNI